MLGTLPMTDRSKPLRRTVLAATGAVLGLGTTVSASDDGPENECYPNEIGCDDDGFVKPGYEDDYDLEDDHDHGHDAGCDGCQNADETQVRTRHCDDRQYKRGAHDWSDGAITFQNCSSKSCSAYVEVSGVVDPKREANTGQPTGNTLQIDLAAGQRQTVWFTGSVKQLQLEHHSINVGISQRVDDCC